MLRNEQGFTLLEVLMAALVVSIAMSGLMSVFLLAAKQGNTSTNKGSVAFYERRIMDELSYYIMEDPANYATYTGNLISEIQHTCSFMGSPHYILQDADGTGAGTSTHEARRPDGTYMIPATDVLAQQYGVGPTNATYAVQDVSVNGEVMKQINIQVTYTEPAP